MIPTEECISLFQDTYRRITLGNEARHLGTPHQLIMQSSHTSVVAVFEVQCIGLSSQVFLSSGELQWPDIVEIHQLLWRVAMATHSGDPPAPLGHSCGPVQDEG